MGAYNLYLFICMYALWVSNELLYKRAALLGIIITVHSFRLIKCNSQNAHNVHVELLLLSTVFAVWEHFRRLSLFLSFDILPFPLLSSASC